MQGKHWLQSQMANDKFILRAKIDELDLESHKILLKFPKAERHVLCAEMRRTLNDIIRLEERASRMQLSERRRGQKPVRTFEFLQQLDAELGLFKRQINKAESLGYLKAQGKGILGKWTSLAFEVGSLLGSWLLTVEKQVCQTGAQRSVNQGKLF